MRDDAEVRAAERLDEAIDAVLQGRDPGGIDPGTAGVLRALAAVYRPDVPATVRARVTRPPRVRLWPVRAAAVALGALLLAHALPPLFAGQRLAEFLELEYEPHIYREGALAYLVVAVVVLAGALRPERWLRAGVAAGVPLGILLGLFALIEIPHVPNPAGEVFHLTEAAAALVLGALWLRLRRSWRARP